MNDEKETKTKESFAENFRSRLKGLYSKLECTELSLEKNEYAPFVPVWGEEYPSLDQSKRVAFYGRATNGWDEDIWPADDILNCDQSAIDRRLKKVTDDLDSRLQFWNVVMNVAKQILNNLGNIEEDWWKYIVWSNLCKVAPFKGGNPSDKDYDKTWKINKEIFDAELEVLDPRVVVMLCGDDWGRDFIGYALTDADPGYTKINLHRIETINWDKDYRDDRNLTAYEKDGRIFIVSLHPQGKKILPHVAGIVSAIMRFASEGFEDDTASVATVAKIAEAMKKAELTGELEEHFDCAYPYVQFDVESKTMGKLPVRIQTSFCGKPYYGIKFDRGEDPAKFDLIKRTLAPYVATPFEDDVWPVWQYIDDDPAILTHIASLIEKLKTS